MRNFATAPSWALTSLAAMLALVGWASTATSSWHLPIARARGDEFVRVPPAFIGTEALRELEVDGRDAKTTILPIEIVFDADTFEINVGEETYTGTWAPVEGSGRRWTLFFDETSHNGLMARADRLARKTARGVKKVESRGPIEASYKINNKRSHGRIRFQQRVRISFENRSRNKSRSASHTVKAKAPLQPPESRSGWLSADTHVHSTGCGGLFSSPQALHEAQIAADIDIANTLVWGQGWDVDRQFFSGDDHPVSTVSHVLHYDLEVSFFRAAQLGHLNLLGLDSLDFSETPYLTPGSGVPIVDWAVAQSPRALVGVAHGEVWPTDGSFPDPTFSFAVPYESPIHVARGLADFMQFGGVIDKGGVLWQRLQNSGFRLAVAGGSDSPCLSSIGTVRTFVETGGIHSFDAELDGIRAGRSVVAHDDSGWATLFANGRGLGEEVELEAGQWLNVVLEADLHEATEVDLVYQGEVVDTVSMPAAPGRLATGFIPDGSGWLSAQSGKFLTSPIYVIVDGQPIRSAADACYLVRYVGYLAQLVLSEPFDLGEDRDAALTAYAEARQIFLARFIEAGGKTCE